MRALRPSFALIAALAWAAIAPDEAQGRNWTGCYVGGTAGWAGDRSNSTFAPGGAFPVFLGQVAVDTFTQRYRFGDSGVTLGGHAGCDRQWANLLLGVEADLNWSSAESDVVASYPLLTAPTGPTFAAHTDTLTNRLTWYSTLRGRAGWTMDRLLIYGTGGLAVGRLEGTAQLFNNATGLLAFSGSVSTTRAGWTAGGGFEWMLTPAWTLRAEYLYLDFGRFNYAANSSPVSVFLISNTVESRFHVVRAGASYRFAPR